MYQMASPRLVCLLLLLPACHSAPQQFGASAPAPCCRSDFPGEFGSCLRSEHCAQPTAPHCSAFGYCTQVTNARPLPLTSITFIFSKNNPKTVSK